MDVFQVVKALRVQKPGAVRTVVSLSLIANIQCTVCFIIILLTLGAHAQRGLHYNSIC